MRAISCCRASSSDFILDNCTMFWGTGLARGLVPAGFRPSGRPPRHLGDGLGDLRFEGLGRTIENRDGFA